MTGLLLTALALAQPAAPPPAGRWEFRDAAAHDGRPLLAYRPVELADRPPRPLHPDDRPGPGARFGLLPVGNVPDQFRALVRRPGAEPAPELWLDGDGDGRFGPDERHTLKETPAAVPVTIAVRSPGGVRRHPRTVLVRPAADGGLRYAVRGYAAGRLALGGRTVAALLTDQNGDGCFDAPGADRVWLGLDGDGRFDGLTEQFPLGDPITAGGRAVLVKASADGTAVTARERPADLGAVRLTFPGLTAARPLGLTAQLVSDWGELVNLTAAGRATPLPVGRYCVESLSFRLLDDDGRPWSYRFAGERRYDITVARDRETAVDPLAGLALTVTVKAAASAGAGQDVAVTPVFRTPAGLELVQCETQADGAAAPAGAEAEIRLVASDGRVADQARSGFL